MAGTPKARCREQGRRENREADLLQERHDHQVNRSHHRDDQGCGGRVRFVGVLAPDLIPHTLIVVQFFNLMDPAV